MRAQIIDFAKQVFQEWNDDKVSRLAASLSYFTVFSLAPLLVVIIAVAGLVLGASTAQQQVIGQVQSVLGSDSAGLINQLLDHTRQIQTNLIAAVIGILVIILGATGVVGELKDALNTIWNVAPKPGRGIFADLLSRLFSFGMVLAIGFLLLVSFVISTALHALGNTVQSYVGQWVMLAQGLDLIISFGGVFALFAILFKYLPDVHVAWRDVLVGALVTALLFTGGKYAIGFYLGSSSIATPYGAAGSLVVIFIWIFYTAQILFLGAEITQVYSNRYGRGIVPASTAVALSDAARVEQGTRAPSTPGAVPTPEATANTLGTPVLVSSASHTAPSWNGSFIPQPALAQTSPPIASPKRDYNNKFYLLGAIGVGVFVFVGKLLSRRNSAPVQALHSKASGTHYS